jgi:hypothetical protein
MYHEGTYEKFEVFNFSRALLNMDFKQGEYLKVILE